MVRTLAAAAATTLLAVLLGCSVESGNNVTDSSVSDDPTHGATASAGHDASGKVTGKVVIEGSSTIFPISAAIAEEFENSTEAEVTVGETGSGAGFKKFVVGELDISNASRPIKEAERTTAEENNVDFTELKVATDGISVVVNPENDWVDSLTVEQLRELWKQDRTAKTWKDLNPEWPDEEIKLFGPGPESGTFDYFGEVILDEGPQIAGDQYTASKDDNQLVNGVATEKNGLGYFGYSYYVNNKDRVKAVAIDGGNGPVEPTFENIESGDYTPLARPLFLYINNKRAAENEAVRKYVAYFVSDAGQEVIKNEGFVVLGEEALKKTRETASKVTGE